MIFISNYECNPFVLKTCHFFNYVLVKKRFFNGLIQGRYSASVNNLRWSETINENLFISLYETAFRDESNEPVPAFLQ